MTQWLDTMHVVPKHRGSWPQFPSELSTPFSWSSVTPISWSHPRPLFHGQVRSLFHDRTNSWFIQSNPIPNRIRIIRIHSTEQRIISTTTPQLSPDLLGIYHKFSPSSLNDMLCKCTNNTICIITNNNMHITRSSWSLVSHTLTVIHKELPLLC